MKDGLWMLYALGAAALFLLLFSFCTLLVGSP